MTLTCEHDKCTKRPNFNFEGKKKGKFCSQHKLTGMVDFAHIQCEHDKCTKSPKFNFEGQKKGRFCKQHAYPGMVDVINSRCEHDKCTKNPKFNFEGKKKGRFCKQHAYPGMVNVTNSRCEYDKCTKRPSFNIEGQKKGRFCSQHALTGMVDVAHKQCLTDGCLIQPKGVKYKGYCLQCFMRAYPDEPVSRNYKIKETHVVSHVKERFTQVTWICDKRYDFAPTECGSKRRPDMYCHMGHFVLVVEIDENQHRKYDESCNNKRLCELYQDFNYVPIVFIRFNPDDYIDKDKNNITSCFGNDKTGICKIKKSKIKEFDQRMEGLYNTIEKYLSIDENYFKKSITQEYLYFDETC